MNILIANTQEFNPTIGGVERISNAYAQQLQKLGHRVWFVACLRSPYSEAYTPAAPQCILPQEQYDTPENVDALCALIKEEKICVIHNQAGNIPGFTVLCAKAASRVGIPVVSVVHNDPVSQLTGLRDFRFSRVLAGENLKALARMALYPFRVSRMKRHVRDTYRQIMACSTATVLLSPSYIPHLRQIDPDAKLTAIPNWLPFDETELCTEKENTVLFVGRLDHEQKRPDRMLDIWQTICGDFPQWKLKLAGDGPLGETLKRYVKKHKIPRVEFLGFCDPREEYSKAKILCQTSTIEGLSMVLLEGMSYGCVPVVYDSYAAVHDVIDSGKNGWIIRAFRQGSFVKALKRLMTDEPLRCSMAAAATNIGERFHKESIVEKWLALYSRCLEETK